MFEYSIIPILTDILWFLGAFENLLPANPDTIVALIGVKEDGFFYLIIIDLYPGKIQIKSVIQCKNIFRLPILLLCNFKAFS